ncbi:hypothetical protein RJZ90_007976 [Blastomyces dermatitidis]
MQKLEESTGPAGPEARAEGAEAEEMKGGGAGPDERREPPGAERLRPGVRTTFPAGEGEEATFESHY